MILFQKMRSMEVIALSIVWLVWTILLFLFFLVVLAPCGKERLYINKNNTMSLFFKFCGCLIKCRQSRMLCVFKLSFELPGMSDLCILEGFGQLGKVILT